MTTTLTLREFDIAEVNWKFEHEALRAVRRQVFILEQKIAAEEEWDGLDDEAWHWLATGPGGNPVGTGRLLPTGQIGRMAVLAEHRRVGIGTALLEQIMRKAASLGMKAVFLHAQREVVEFYRRAGFQPEGREFTEAGIAHVRMMRELEPADFRQEEIAPPPNPLAATLQQFDVREADWNADRKSLTSVRTRVFVHEQHVPVDTEQDGRDETAYHWIAEDFEGIPLGTVRMLADGQIGRMAVISEYRRKGVATALLEMALRKARWLGLPEVFLHAQMDAVPFWADSGFERRGDEFMEAGIRHVEMHQALEPAEEPERPRRPGTRKRKFHDGAAFPEQSDAGSERILGETNQIILVRSEEECRAVSIELARQSRLRLRIHSPWFDHRLYDNAEFAEALSQLARRNRYTEIQVLIWNSHRIVKNGHAILDLSRRLSSSIHVRVVHPDYRQMNHEYILADDAGIIYRQEFELYEGYANFYDKTEVNRLGREFLHAWETSHEDPNLRQLKI